MRDYHYIITLQSVDSGQSITVSAVVELPPTIDRSEVFNQVLAQLTEQHFPSAGAIVHFFDLRPNTLG